MSRVFPLATVEDLREELEATDRAIDRLDSGVIVDLEQRAARRRRLEWWRGRICQQLEEMEETC